jgi:chemotaxis protein MotA
MDFATLIGIISGIALVISSIMLNSGLELFWSPPSLMIVLGGTFAATLIAYPINEFVARKGGVLAIESRLNQIDNKFLQKGLLLTVDGKDEATVNGLLRREIKQVQKSHKDGWDIFNQMGKFSPAFGMIGTLIGLIQMLSDLDNVETVGPKMAVALITTFYGALLANLIFIPVTVKLRRRSSTETLEMNLVLEGITYIRKGVNPRFMKEVLENYMDSYLGKKLKKEGVVTTPPPKARVKSQPKPEN